MELRIVLRIMSAIKNGLTRVVDIDAFTLLLHCIRNFFSFGMKKLWTSDTDALLKTQSNT